MNKNVLANVAGMMSY